MRKFKFKGTNELNDKGEKVLVGKNFGRFGFIDIGATISTKDEVEAANISDHPEFEEITEKKPAAPASK